MDIKKLKTKLSQYRVSQGHATESKRFYDQMVAETEAELAEAEKPELRHGELRIWRQDGINTMTKDLPVVVDLSEPEPHILFLGEHISPSRVEYAEKTILKLSDPVGYAFDDITGLSEDVEEFDFEGNDEAGLTGRVKWWTHKDGTRYLHIDQGCDRISILAKNFSAFVRGLRQMAATAKRKE